MVSKEKNHPISFSSINILHFLVRKFGNFLLSNFNYRKLADYEVYAAKKLTMRMKNRTYFSSRHAIAQKSTSILHMGNVICIAQTAAAAPTTTTIKNTIKKLCSNFTDIQLWKILNVRGFNSTRI